MNIQSTVPLNNGIPIPWLGLGVYQSEPGDETRTAVRWAIEAGYRHVDTAAFYGNEESVAQGIRDSGIDRSEIFVTTKLWNDDHGYDRVMTAFDESRRRLDCDVIDLFLIHWPMKGKYLDSWRAFEKLYADEKIRAIGVSNFLEVHLEPLLADFDVVPAVNQVEWHPRVLQRPLVDFCRSKGIQFQAWSPLGRAKYLDDPTLTTIAERHGKSPAQVLIRWDLEHEVVTIPKSVTRERIVSNADVFDFSLSADEIASIDALDRDERFGPHPLEFCG